MVQAHGLRFYDFTPFGLVASQDWSIVWIIVWGGAQFRKHRWLWCVKRVTSLLAGNILAPWEWSFSKRESTLFIKKGGGGVDGWAACPNHSALSGRRQGRHSLKDGTSQSHNSDRAGTACCIQGTPNRTPPREVRGDFSYTDCIDEPPNPPSSLIQCIPLKSMYLFTYIVSL